ncbi:ERCC4 domain-containing protein [Alkalispirochaeta alkalica]|uniref:ERCC4 domain-containing protein n=1 Tax=Alkalispirochaeta alkalica TaxID=46356 RepID=UPI00036AB54B|nr:ERCC4 domain-containing protein [Alkalispirochaeta alkalica]
MENPALWILYTTGNDRFPYRVEIRRGTEQVIALWTQDKWPGSGKQIFCIREGEPDGEPWQFTEVERVPVVRLERFGKQLTVILDRPTRKRCNFLFLQKRYKNRPGTYEQIFFRTQQGMNQHRSSSRVRLPPGHSPYRVIVDSAERYPWKFPGPATERRKLPAGDYALEIDHQLHAVVERKTFENLLSDFSSLQGLHAKLDDLGRWDHAAVVIEAEYRDFLNPRKMEGRWPITHALRVLAELHVVHRGIQFVYAGSRKAGEQWTNAWFSARAKELWHRREEPHPDQDQPDRVAQAGEPPAVYAADNLRSSGDSTQDLRQLILDGAALEEPFSIAELRTLVPDLPDQRLRTTMQNLKKEGRLERIGAGRAARWRRC